MKDDNKHADSNAELVREGLEYLDSLKNHPDLIRQGLGYLLEQNYDNCFKKINQELKELCELTNNPRLYEYTYWGCLRREVDPITITNRNSFFIQYELVSHVKSTGLIQAKRFMDHIECYKTKTDGYVTICSFYADEQGISKETASDLQSEGFEVCKYSLYDQTSVTVIKFFSDEKEYNEFVKHINDGAGL